MENIRLITKYQNTKKIRRERDKKERMREAFS
jgi:hypothetical protein